MSLIGFMAITDDRAIVLFMGFVACFVDGNFLRDYPRLVKCGPYRNRPTLWLHVFSFRFAFSIERGLLSP